MKVKKFVDLIDGLMVGNEVFIDVGKCVGINDGLNVGLFDGIDVGFKVGNIVCLCDGFPVGVDIGKDVVGVIVGRWEGTFVGHLDDWKEGALGKQLGRFVGVNVGELVLVIEGILVGWKDERRDGVFVGFTLGLIDGSMVGIFVGWNDGTVGSSVNKKVGIKEVHVGLKLGVPVKSQFNCFLEFKKILVGFVITWPNQYTHFKVFIDLKASDPWK